ncbi:hypothetical protein TKK_0005601 [Trichogramma kaykai]
MCVIANFFDNKNLFESMAYVNDWRYDMCFLDAIKSILVTPSLSFYDLLEKTPKKLAEAGITFREFIYLEKKIRQEKEKAEEKEKECVALSPLAVLPKKYSDCIVRILAEKVARGCFLRLARKKPYASENQVEEMNNEKLLRFVFKQNY